ncbi:hypothetical protein Anas_13584 [Armadillidium nasatum]|uniref:Uncharacterized protein n=1 Tax=Armadillidium nasatum TaxID=96803 RepID=A0A5N5T0W2_9CRUS|nr:hypothetical protein Anas_13584 [Armadillidium nasatum]
MLRFVFQKRLKKKVLREYFEFQSKMFSLFWFQNKNEPPESVGEVNSPSSDESSEFEEVWPEIETFHEPLCFNDEDVVNGEDLEQTSALEEIQDESDSDVKLRCQYEG